MTTYPTWVLEREDFPELLRQIPDAPERLYVRGTLPTNDLTPLCVVGSRALTSYGSRVCATLIAGLRGAPISIVSGLALGADAAAHEAALDAGLPTVAVLPSSVDDKSIYPTTNYALAQRILSMGGALVSEYEGPCKPAAYSFAARNRIMAGMSKAVLVVEAAAKSGTLITARLALDYNRDVMAVPHDLGRAQGEGANKLIRDGAVLVRDSQDICMTLGIETSNGEATLPADLTDTEALIMEALTAPLERNDLIEACGLDASTAGIALSKLMIRGLIIERLGMIERL